MTINLFKNKKINFCKEKLTAMLVLFAVAITSFLMGNVSDIKAENTKYNFSYTGNYQEFVAPNDGTYKVQLWGAQGGSSRLNNVVSTTNVGGYGAYTSGMIELKKGQKFYIYVGGRGTNGVKSGYAAGGWNGGGRGDYDHADDEAAGGGGGATDIRLTPGASNDFASLKSRIMVAAGGGGTSNSTPLGFGGGLSSSATATSAGATQTSGYSFGVGMAGTIGYSNYPVSGGGGGYYGGYATPKSATYTTASGGSSFISGFDGCNAIDDTSTSTAIVHSGQSIHYSGLKFDNAIMIRGNGFAEYNGDLSDYLMPTTTGTSFASGTGNNSNGYATIEYLETIEKDDYPNYSINVGTSYKYAYTGNYQTFIAPANGNYKLEAWGGRGGAGMRNSALTYHGGYGGYASGETHLNKGDTFYVYVGQAGYNGRANCKYCGGYGGYNGGAQGGNDSNHDSSPDEGGGGGGATDFRLTSGTWNDFNSLKSRVLIAGGGAGGTYGQYGGVGGLYLNNNSTYLYQFGTGQKGYAATSGSGGGGGGYFGGKSNQCDGCVGYGGSSYVSGSSDDLAVTADSTSASIALSDNSTHYTGLSFSNPTKVNGGNSMINWGGTATMTGNNNNGYAKVTILSLDAGLPKLKKLSVSGGSFKQEFTSDVYSYDVYVDSESYDVTIDGEVLNDNTNVFRGFGKTTLEAGENHIYIGLIDDLGNVVIYSLNIHRPASSYKYLSDIKVDDISIADFDPETLTYMVHLDDTVEEVNLEAIAGRPSQKITGNGKVIIGFGTTTQEIEVVSEDESYVTTYTIDFQKSNSSKLKSLSVDGYTITPEFDPEVLDYSVAVSTGALYADVIAVPYDISAKVTISGNGYFAPNKSNTIKVVVYQKNAGTTTYLINVIKEGSVEDKEYRYECVNAYQTFEAPGTTYYKIQSWGARGGYGRTNSSLKKRGGYGAYTEGQIRLQKGEKLYVYVGCSGANGASVSKYVGGLGGWNGGAKGGNDSNHDSQPDSGGGGGGASDIRLDATSSTSTWNEFNSLKSRIMVAAGGGGGNYSRLGGAGGTLEGNVTYASQKKATQISGYAFGYGMAGGTCTDGSGGAGGGYYGGFTGTGCSYGGGGGSSYISGCEDCVGITEDSLGDAITSSGVSNHYSNYVFDNITMLSGDESMPSQNGGYQTGNNGNGTVIITALKDRSSNNFLSEITTNKGSLSPTFDMQTYEYNLELDSEDTEIKLGARLEDDTATLSGIGTFRVPAGTTQFPITVTAENGDIKVYTVNVTRDASSNALPKNIFISGLVPTLCSVNDFYCKLNQEFSPDIHTYTMTVPSRIKQLQFTVDKGHYYQTIAGDGVVSLSSGANVIIIEITSEDGTNTETYTYNIERDMTGNANIEKLDVIDPTVDINFDSEVTDYYFSIENNYTSVGLDIILEDEKASYVVEGNENFVTGLNVVRVVVTAANGEEKTYNLNIYREQSGNVFLTNIEATHNDVIYEFTPTFNKVITTYIVNVPNDVSSVTLNASAEDPLTVVGGLGEKTLKTGVNKFNITTTSEDGSTEVYTVSIIRAKSSDATLKSLDVLESSLTPEFNSNTFEYKLDVNPGVTSLNINAILNDAAASYKIVGNSGFKVGTNIVNIIVTAEDGTRNTYVLEVNRIASENNYLDMLTTDQYDLTDIFDKETSTYDFTVENSVSTIVVSATAEDKLSKVVGTGKYTLKTGTNEINITVTSENGDTRIYTLNVTRKKSSNANLLSISTDSDVIFNPVFERDTVDYQIEVENDISSITILGIAEDKTATVEGNGIKKLDVGTNFVSLVVTAEDGTQKIYNLTINRKKSSNCNALSIIAKESVLDPEFNSSVTSYDLRVLEGVTSLTLNVTLDSDKASYEVLGNSDFSIGNNEVKVVVTAEDGTQKMYILNVLRQEAGTTSNYLLSLNMVEKALTPSFDKDTIYYEVTVPYTMSGVTIEGELDDKNATVTGLGHHNLVVGKNVIGVKVTSTEGIVRTYQIVVNREENDEARLSNLSVTGSSLSPIFNKDKDEYSIASSNSDLAITATTIDPKATYEIIGGSNLSVGMSDVIVRVTASNKITTKDYTLHVNRQSSNNNNLKSLDIDGVSYTPAFSKTTTVYYATVARDVNNIQITALAEDVNATVEGDGESELEVGVNYKEITVTSESGKTKIYTVIITRTPNDNSYLKSLNVSSGELAPEFDKTIDNYSVTVPYEDDEILVDGTLEDDTSSVTGFDKYKLDEGENTINVTVTSEAGNVHVYTIKVTRLGIVSSKLKSLEVKNYALNQSFNQDVFDYSTTIDNEITSLVLNLETLDKNATYEIIGNENFVVGMNTVSIKVTDSLGLTTSIYTLNVNRQAYSNTFLSYITTDVGTLVPDFTKTELSYTVTVGNDVDKINIYADAEIESNTVTGPGSYDLVPGNNKIPITVKSPTGISRCYYINVFRSLSNDNYLESLHVKVNNEVQTLTPEFSKDTLSYNLSVPSGTTSLNISGSASLNATVVGFGNKNVSLGSNKYNIVITSESGNIKTYTINVERGASSDNYLTNIEPSVGELDPSFSYTGTDYYLKLDSTQSLLSFDVSLSDRFASVTGTDTEVIPDGASTRIIIVTAEDGSKRVYTIHVTKDRTDEARLSSLKVNGYDFSEEFSSDKFNYTLTVPSTKKSLLASEVSAVAIDSNATIEKTSSITLSSLSTNIYTIVVTAKDGFTKQNYYINVDREKGSEALLSSLSFKFGVLHPTFNSTLMEYTLTVPNDTTLLTADDVVALATDDSATVSKMASLAVDGKDDKYTITVTSGDLSTTNTYVVNVLYDKSPDATLKSLSVKDWDISPTFDSTNKVYTVNVTDITNSITIDALANHEKATIISGLGEHSLDKDDMNFDITIQAEDGTIMIYTVHVLKSITTEKSLDGISLSGDCTEEECGLTPSFTDTVTKYSTEVDNDKKNINIDVVKKNVNQVVKYYNNSTNEEISNIGYQLQVGLNSIRIDVSNGVGDLTSYYLDITRLKSSNNYLSSLEITNATVDFDFSKTTQEYSVSIPYELDKVVINAVAEDKTASVTVSGSTYLDEGNNDVLIKVVAEDGNLREYIIHVCRESESNYYLKSLTISSGTIYKTTPNFIKTTFDYVVTVPSNVNIVTIDAVADIDTTTVTGIGEKTLKTGVNNFIITTTSIDGVVANYNITIIKEKSTKLYLKSLSAKEGVLNEEFNRETMNYTMDVASDVSKLSLSVVPEDSTVSYEILGNNNFVTGKNSVYIVLTNSDKTVTTTYKLVVNKKVDSNNYLSSLQVNDKELITTETKSLTSFTVNVSSGVNQVVVNGSTESKGATTTGFGTYSLDYGDNIIKVVVEAEDKSIRTYTITVKREYDLDLFMITTNRGTVTPTVSKEVTDYYLDVDRSISDITIVAVANSSDVRVDGNGYYDLDVSENIIPIKVVAADKTSKIYNLHVTRNKADNNYLSNLYVHDGVISPEFNKEVTTYDVEVPNGTNSLVMDITPEDVNASYEVIGNSDFILGKNTVTIKVTAENGDVKTYSIIVDVQDESLYSNYLTNLIVNKGTLSPDFSKEINSYTVSVTTDITSITVSGVLESVYAKVTGFGEHKLNMGRNEISIVVTSKDNKIRTYSIIVYRVASSDARIKSLSFNEGSLTPLFDKDIDKYTMTIDSSISSLTENVIPLVNGTTYTISGNHNIQIGSTDIIITSTAGDGITTKTYTITVIKEKSTNNLLESLTSNISDLSPTFDKNQTGPYTINVGDEVNSITLSGKAEASTSTVVGFGVHSINRGANTISVSVTSESGDVRVYTVIVNKSLSSDNYLSLLATSDGDLNPTFDKDTLSYSVNVSALVSEITVLGIANNKYATVTGNGNYSLSDGDNTIAITVEAEDGSKRIYKIVVKKAKPASSKLLNIKAKEGILSPTFDKNTLEYNISVPNEVTSLTLDITKEDSTANYEVIGNSDFKIGANQVSIKVSASDGAITTYTLNVIRQVASNNFLKSITIDNGSLTPKFDRATQYYEVEVAPEIDKINITGIGEDINATVNGNGVKMLDKGDNFIYLTVTSSSGVDRVYTIKVVRKLSSNNLLKSLSVNNGDLNPTFNSFTNNYNLKVGEGIDSLDVSAIADDSNATVAGDGNVSLSNGENIISVVVTAEDGTTNVYTITAVKTASSNTNIINIVPSSGVLSPNYTDSIDSYEVNVDEDISIIDFDVSLESAFATVSGDKNNYLDYGNNQITIKVKAEDGTERHVYINVIREKNITSIDVSKEEVMMAKGDTETIEVTLNPFDVTNNSIGWKALDTSIVEVVDGVIEAREVGTTTVEVYSIKNPNIKKIITVNVVNLKITSSSYEVRRDIIDYIIGADTSETLDVFAAKLDNNTSMLHFYNADDTEITTLEEEQVKTGQYITLEYNGKIYDKIYIAVRGEVTGDGVINVKDYNTVIKHILKKETLENYWFSVGNVDDESSGIINVKDSNKIQNKILGKISSLNSE